VKKLSKNQVIYLPEGTSWVSGKTYFNGKIIFEGRIEILVKIRTNTVDIQKYGRLLSLQLVSISINGFNEFSYSTLNSDGSLINDSGKNVYMLEIFEPIN